MDENKIKKLDRTTQKLFRNAHPFCDEINKFFPKFQPPDAIPNSSTVEQNQSVKEWKGAFSMHRLSNYRRMKSKKICIQPIGPFPKEHGADVVFDNLFKTIADYLRIFFKGLDIEIFDIVDHRDIEVKTRVHSITKQRQLFLPDVMTSLVRSRPKNVFCIVGISWFDFYPSDNENHILGEGSFLKGVAACSFGHYSLYKEREHIQKEYWKADFVVEPPIEIQGCQSLDGTTKEKDSTYIYVTQNEKEEAKLQVPDIDSPCKSLSSSPASPTLKRIKNRFSMIRSIPQSLIGSFLSSESDLNSPTDLNMSEVNYDDHDSDDVFDGFEVISYSESNSLTEQSSKRTANDFLKCSIPIDCKFNLNCKVFRRLLRGTTHEICHVIGLRHCQYYMCTMNVSLSVLASDRQPIILCPVCLRKLHIFLNFDVLERYGRLTTYLQDHINYCCSAVNKNSQDDSISLSEDTSCRFCNDTQNIESIIEFMKR